MTFSWCWVKQYKAQEMQTRGGDGGGQVTLYKVYSAMARAAVLVKAVRRSRVVMFRQVRDWVWAGSVRGQEVTNFVGVCKVQGVIVPVEQVQGSGGTSSRKRQGQGVRELAKEPPDWSIDRGGVRVRGGQQ